MVGTTVVAHLEVILKYSFVHNLLTAEHPRPQEPVPGSFPAQWNH